MKGKLVTMVGIAAVFGAASIFMADIWIRSATDARAEKIVASAPVPPPAPQVEFKTMVVAAAPLRFGMELEPSTLAEIPWPEKSLPKGAFATIDALMAKGSRAVLSPIEINEPVLLAKLSGPGGRGTLSNLLSPGMRAVTIKTDEIAGVGGFIAPGDRVDVVLTRDAGAIEEVASNARGASGSTITSEIVVENVKVLTVGQGADEREISPKIANSVTIEVTPGGAGKIALARNVGSLSLSLRSAGEGGDSSSGITTISAFGGSAGNLLEKPSSLFGNDESEQKFTTVIVTRGLVAQSYQVVAPDQE